MYQCLRKSQGSCSSKKMIKYTHGMSQALWELKCEIAATIDPNAPYNQEICMKSIMIRLENWNRCTSTYILPEVTYRRPCIQQDTITVGDDPTTKYVQGVQNVEECNCQCALEKTCTNWVFDSKTKSWTLKRNLFNKTVQDIVPAPRPP
mmetsp:Transcript_1135/g.1335  ORF Transcript_1135/g.1335 Transcript_1135/m.1335 type:complete len:149 (-) Transcript_1135:5671-6117(-)